jgi:hypothetical protein
MVITFEDNGVSKIMGYDFPKSVRYSDFEHEVKQNLHKKSIREQMTFEFKKLCGDSPSENTIGWALEYISNRRFYSKIERIVFHHNKSLHNFNVKFPHETNKRILEQS